MESKFGLRMLALALVFATSCFFTGCEVSVESGNPRDYFFSDDIQYFPTPEDNMLKEETEKLKKARKEAIEAKKQKQMEIEQSQTAP